MLKEVKCRYLQMCQSSPCMQKPNQRLGMQKNRLPKGRT